MPSRGEQRQVSDRAGIEKLGLEKSNDVREGDYRWLTVRVPGDPSTEISLETAGLLATAHD